MQFIRSRPLFCQLRFAGHNKWSKIRHAKGANDARRAKQAGKIVSQIVSGIRAMNGESDPSHNHYLAAALNMAKAAQIPKKTVEDAITRGKGIKNDGKVVKLNRYEGLGPGGTAFVVEALVSNPAKTAAEIKHIFKQKGGSLSAVEYLFTKRGHVSFKNGQCKKTIDEMYDDAIEVNVEDIADDNDVDHFEIYCSETSVFKIQAALEMKGYEIIEWGVGYVPIERIKIEGEVAEEFSSTLDLLEDQDEVVKVYHNAQ